MTSVRGKKKKTNQVKKAWIAARIPLSLRQEIDALVSDDTKVQSVVANLLRDGLAARKHSSSTPSIDQSSRQLNSQVATSR